VCSRTNTNHREECMPSCLRIKSEFLDVACWADETQEEAMTTHLSNEVKERKG